MEHLMVDKDDSLSLDEQLCFAAYTVSQAFNRAYRPLLDPLGLTYPQFLVMLVLWEGDNIAISDIGSRIHLDSGTLTPLLKRLEANGFVKRQRNPKDEREVRISLTPAGQTLRRKAAAARAQVACATNLDTSGIGSLRGQLMKLRTNLLSD
jgi:DNA-binding MarR family transcriptional regulator